MRQQASPYEYIVRNAQSCASHHGHIPPRTTAETDVKAIQKPERDPGVRAT